ncbi:unannotated protein [freshwater metagenome]|uniref:Unannotated protein n=1 Tax=freshwater metagenome TaxID=449393 RepID=A0A6J6YBY0_9ZZZZ
MVELVGNESPTTVLFANEILGGNTNVVEVGGVDVVLAHESKRLNRDARGIHRNDDDRNALVLLGLGISTNRKPAVVGTTSE